MCSFSKIEISAKSLHPFVQHVQSYTIYITLYSSTGSKRTPYTVQHVQHVQRLLVSITVSANVLYEGCGEFVKGFVT